MEPPGRGGGGQFTAQLVMSRVCPYFSTFLQAWARGFLVVFTITAPSGGAGNLYALQFMPLQNLYALQFMPLQFILPLAALCVCHPLGPLCRAHRHLQERG